MFTALSADLKSEEPIDVVCHESYPDNATLWDEWTMLKYVPFNPVDKFTMDICKENKTGTIYRVLKGAPQVGFLLIIFFLFLSPLHHSTLIVD
jgi:H+-transporting ATPase